MARPTWRRSSGTELDCPVRIERLARNTGFAAGMNRAIQLASEPFVFLMNPDVRLLPDTLARLLEQMDRLDETAYAVGPKLMRADGPELRATRTTDSTGVWMSRDGRHFDRDAGKPDDGRHAAVEEVFGLTGAAVLFRRQALLDARVDGQVFDEDFFAYREDVDLAWRMRGFGYRAWYEPRAVAFHRRRVTPERRRSLPAEINYHSVKNRFLLRIHHADKGWLRAHGLRSALRDVLVIGGCLALERSSLPAFGWLWHHRDRHLQRRREILARRTIPSADLRSWFT